MADELSFDRPSPADQILRAKILSNKASLDENYRYSDLWQSWDKKNPLTIHSTSELVEAIKGGKLPIEVEARVLAFNTKERKRGFYKLEAKGLVETFSRQHRKLKLREATDLFSFDAEGQVSSKVGDDFVPLLGGPFNKQLYYYDYLRMHALAFQAFHHDPIARAIVQITRDFTLGRGFRVDCKSEKHLAVWRAFEDVNDLQNLMRQIAEELSIYGEIMPWFLPNGETKIGYRLGKGQEVPRGLLPRVRLIDPSVIWEVITYPEDITRVLAYQWVAPTQYQIYTARDGGGQVPTTKFIYQQIPAEQVLHFKINSVSNEKRGRSDLFPVLGYLKRLRDSVQYSIISMQKQAAWSIDTTIKGSPADVDNYVNAIGQMDTIAAAGSEFVHNESVTRQFLANAAGKGGQADAFEWCLSMIAAGTGIPVQYFGTHLSGAQTRASALVATEPVAKKFEMRQVEYERIIKAMASKLWDYLGLPPVEVEVTFPELIVQDRSAKLKDLAVGQASRWWSQKRAAEVAAKEMGFTEFDFDTEQEQIQKEQGPGANPLSAIGSLSKVVKDVSGDADKADAGAPTGISSEMRRDVEQADRH